MDEFDVYPRKGLKIEETTRTRGKGEEKTERKCISGKLSTKGKSKEEIEGKGIQETDGKGTIYGRKR